MDDLVLELIGVEHEAGGLGREQPVTDEGTDTHCGLCGLTSDKSAWAALGDELGLPVHLSGSGDLGPEEQQVVREVGTPVVLARLEHAELRPVVLSERLEVFEGDVTRLAREVRLVAEQQGWVLPCGDGEPEPEKVCD